MCGQLKPFCRTSTRIGLARSYLRRIVHDTHVPWRSATCQTPFTLCIRTYSPPPHSPPQKCSTYSSASVLFKFSPTRETTKYPKLLGNLASKSPVFAPKSLGLTKMARAPLGRRKSVLTSVENTLFRKKLVRVIRDDCANQGSESELRRDLSEGANQDCASNPLPSRVHMRQSELRRMTISTVRPAPHLSISGTASCEKSADRIAPVSACVRLCSTAKSSPARTSRRPIPAVAYRTIFLKRFWLMPDPRAAWPVILTLMVQDWRGAGRVSA